MEWSSLYQDHFSHNTLIKSTLRCIREIWLGVIGVVSVALSVVVQVWLLKTGRFDLSMSVLYRIRVGC